SLKVTVYKNGSKYKITITTNKEQTITMRVLDSEGNLKYIDQIDKLNGTKEINTLIETSNNKLYIKGTLTETLELSF
ncbi:MAG: hypothetical protein N2Z71_07175, partial [Caloramator sp.]|nr:hypothetical protein [Caloramator sp.]